MRVTAAGQTGFGWSNGSREQAQAVVGSPLRDLSAAPGTLGLKFAALEFPLLDLWGRVAGRPVHERVAGEPGAKADAPLEVPCYDTSSLIDDLHLKDAAAASLLQAEAEEGWAQGHRAFKIKAACARHMP